MCTGSAAAPVSSKAGKRKAFQPCDDIDPSLKLVRSASANLAKQTGRPRAVARAALDALGEDRDQACRLLLSGLALAVLDSEPCEVELLAKGIPVWLKEEGEESRSTVLGVGAFEGCFLLRVQKGRQEPLRLFALEPVDVCLVSAPGLTVEEAWAELEYTEAPAVEGLEKDSVIHSCSYDPGPVQVPLDRCEGKPSLILVRVVKKTNIIAPPNSMSRARRRPREAAKRSSGLAELAEEAPKRWRYQRQAQIGSGTFGKVFLAEQFEASSEEAPARKVAIKEVAYQSHKTREITLLKSITHSCVVSLLDSFVEPGEDDAKVLCMVLEYLPQNLHQKIGGEPLCVEDVRCFSFQLLRALAHLDGTRIVHRDLKPENILLDPGSRAVRVADFGSAKVLDGEPSSSYICSRWWRAPELIFGASRYGTSVDWWSCGCITAEMMLGRPLFTGESSWGQMYEIVRALGTPTMEEVEAMQAGGDCRLAGHFAKLAELERPASAWEELLPAFAEERQALELPESLLSFDPAKRLHPVVAMRSSFFQHLPDDPNPLPPNLADYSEEELSTCDTMAKKKLWALKLMLQARSPFLDTESVGKRPGYEEEESRDAKRRRVGDRPVDDLSDIP